MANIKALVTLQKDGQTFLPGAVVTDVDDKEADALVKAGKAEKATKKEADEAAANTDAGQGADNGQGGKAGDDKGGK